MLFSIVIDFSVSPASQSKERLTGETSVEPLSFSLGCVSGRVGVNSQPSLAVLEVWEKDGLELCQRLIGAGVWAACSWGVGSAVLYRGTGVTRNRRQRKSLSVPGGLGKTQCSKPVQIKGSWIAHGPSTWDTNIAAWWVPSWGELYFAF